MSIRIISYSLTGNNNILAQSLAEALGAKHIRITEKKDRNLWTTALDMLLNRRPTVDYSPDEIRSDGTLLFVAPVWMGSVASPMRDCFKQLREKADRYFFISISGGADGSNPKLGEELKKRLRKEPASVIDMHIADLLPLEPKPTREDTSVYKISAEDTKMLSEKVISRLKKEGVI